MQKVSWQLGIAQVARIRLHRVPLSLGRFLGVTFLVLAFCRVATAESSFYAQCHKLLPIADDFAHECQQRARPFSRTFYPSGGSRGEVESYSTFFKALDAPSHFVLGCVLDFKHRISFAGLYYSALALDMAHFDDYQIAFIDPDDNVGFQIDGVQRSLVAVRQFVTDVIPAKLTGRPKNCEDPHIEAIDGSSAAALVHLRRIDQGRMEYCIGDYCRTVRYLTFGGVHEAPIIYTFYDLFLIDSNGVLMLKEPSLRGALATTASAEARRAKAEAIQLAADHDPPL
jgi:hypothetical protein